MKTEIKTNSLKGLLVNIAAVLGLLALMSFTFFYVMLPRITNKDAVVTVPDISGMTLEEAIDALKIRDLDYRIADSTYRFEAAPLTVLEQYPKPLARVKIYRKIDVSLNAKIPPSIYYPDLTGSSYDFALAQLRSLDLKVGIVDYQQDIAHNSILESRVGDNIVQAGQLIPKGTTINLIVGQDSLKLTQ